MNRPLTVLIDTYNHERYIEEAILSVIEQDFPASDFEVLVVDDGSTDRTPEVVQKFAPRVRLLLKKNGGQASALNAGIAEARGEIVSFLDGDDWFAPGKLTAVAEAVQQHPEAAAIGHGYYEVKESAQEITAHAAPATKLLHLADRQAARDALLSMPFLHNSALTVRREVLERVSPIPETLIFCADAPLAVASMAAGLLLLDRPLLYYRLHAGNLYAGIDSTNSAAVRRRCEVEEMTFQQLEMLLLRLSVSRQSIEALLYPWWTECSRFSLRTFGGQRSQAFRTEMRAFRSQGQKPTLSNSLFKYLIVGAATLALSPRRFYAMRDWYAQKNLGRLRGQPVGGG